MGYEDSAACKFISTTCVICGKELVDAVSVEAGVGPKCREKYGYGEQQVGAEKALSKVGVPLIDGRVDKLFRASKYRNASNVLLHFVAVSGAGTTEGIRAAWVVRELGFITLSNKILRRLVRVTVEVDGDKLAVTSPFNEQFVTRSRDISGRKWDGSRKATLFDDSPANRRLLLPLLKTSYPGQFIRANGTLFFPDGTMLGRKPPSAPTSDRTPKDRSLSLSPSGDKAELRTRYYDAEVIQNIRDVKPRTWVPSGKFHEFPLSPPVIKQLQDVVPNLWIDPRILETMKGEMAKVEVLGKLASVKSTEDVTALVPKAMVDRINAAVPVGQKLFPYQVAGIAFAEHTHGRVLIGDEMGLGKTVQALGWIALHPEVNRVLVICPAFLRTNWLRHILKWVPDAAVEGVELVSNGTPFFGGRFLVVNYDILEKNKGRLKSWGPEAVVIDESHFIKNEKAKRTKTTIELAGAAKHVICLSGTPMLNRPVELFTQLHLLDPSRFPKFVDFAFTYCSPQRDKYGWSFDGLSNEGRLRSELAHVMVRRVKSEVLKDLPPKSRVTNFVDLTNEKEYRALEEGAVKALAPLIRKGVITAGAWDNVLAHMTSLRKMSGLGKIASAVQWAETFLESTGRQLVIFTHHRIVMDEIAKSLSKNYTVGLIHGGVEKDARMSVVDGFARGELKVVVGTVGAMGLGVDLVAASDALMVEREWTPANEEQAEDRLHRVTQTANVTITYLTASGTIDQDLNEVVEGKRELIKRTIDGAADTGAEKSVIQEVVNRLLSRRSIG